MSTDTDRTMALLQSFLDEEDDTALPRACRIAAGAAVDIDTLLAGIARHRGDPARRSLALRELRATLRLPTVPGPVCRR